MLIEKIKQTGTTNSNYTLGTVLWENPNPTASFVPQTITLSSDNYDYLMIEYIFNSSNDGPRSSTIIEKGMKTKLFGDGIWSGGYAYLTRSITYVSNTTLNVSDALIQDGTSMPAINNALCVPIRIIGFKNTIPTVVQREGEVYDDQERVIGTWFGKPLYRKVIELGTLPNNSEKQIAHNINNLDILVNCYGTAKDTNGNILVFPNVDKDGLKYSVRLVADSTNLKVVTGSDRSGFSGYTTLEYTKTTDTVE